MLTKGLQIFLCLPQSTNLQFWKIQKDCICPRFEINWATAGGEKEDQKKKKGENFKDKKSTIVE